MILELTDLEECALLLLVRLGTLAYRGDDPATIEKAKRPLDYIENAIFNSLADKLKAPQCH